MKRVSCGVVSFRTAFKAWNGVLLASQAVIMTKQVLKLAITLFFVTLGVLVYDKAMEVVSCRVYQVQLTSDR